MDSVTDRRHSSPGFPHSGIPGSRPACGSPRLIAASYALRRLLMPGHSPYTLSSLTMTLLLTHMVFPDLFSFQRTVEVLPQRNRTRVSALSNAVSKNRTQTPLSVCPTSERCLN